MAIKRLSWLVLRASVPSVALAISSPATAIVPAASPEERAQRDLLHAEMKKLVTSQVMRCFPKRRKNHRVPLNARFFIDDEGRRVTNIEILVVDSWPRPPRSAREFAAVRAIKACAPFAIPERLNNWGEYASQATVEFK